MNTKIKVELKDTDLRKDLYSLLKDMDAIRAESIAKGTPQQPKEYQKLAYRMSTNFKGLYSERWDRSINPIELATNEDPRLQNYDRLQIHYWGGHDKGKEFLGNLAQLSMDFFSPADFVALFAQNGEYHLLQALNLLSGNRATSLQEGISLGELVTLEEMHDPMKVVQAYQRLGHAQAVFRISNTDKVAGNIIKQGYDARIEADKIVVHYPQPKIDAFLNAAFGYSKVELQGELYLVSAQQKKLVLLKNGQKCSVNGISDFARAELTKTGAIEVKHEKRYGYLDSAGQPLFERFFEERLTEGLAENIAALEKKIGRERLEWLMSSEVPLKSFSDLPDKGIKLAYDAKIKPSLVLLTMAENIAAKVKDFSSFARAYDAVQTVELPKKETLWEIMDPLSKETVSHLVDNMVQAHKTHGDRLLPLMQAFQDRRSEHESIESLLLSTMDYISAIKEAV